MSDEPKYTLPEYAPFWYEPDLTDNGPVPPQTRHDLIHRVATLISKVNSQHAYWTNIDRLEVYSDTFLLRLWDTMNLNGYSNAQKIISFSIYRGEGTRHLLELIMDNLDKEDLILSVMNERSTYDPALIEEYLRTTTPLAEGTL